DPRDFKNTVAYGQTVYIRLDWKVKDAPENCYYLVPLDLDILEIPELRDWEQEVVFCDNDKVDYNLVATPNNIEELEGHVTYKWYKNGKQIPYSGSIYNVDETGTYKVIVEGEECSAEDSITVKQISLDLDMGDKEVLLCDESE